MTKKYAIASDKLLCEVKITVHLVSNDVSHTCNHGAYMLAAILLARPRRGVLVFLYTGLCFVVQHEIEQTRGAYQAATWVWRVLTTFFITNFVHSLNSI